MAGMLFRLAIVAKSFNFQFLSYCPMGQQLRNPYVEMIERLMAERK
jgi:hypothetical protein